MTKQIESELSAVIASVVNLKVEELLKEKQWIDIVHRTMLGSKLSERSSNDIKLRGWLSTIGEKETSQIVTSVVEFVEPMVKAVTESMLTDIVMKVHQSKK